MVTSNWSSKGGTMNCGIWGVIEKNYCEIMRLLLRSVPQGHVLPRSESESRHCKKRNNVADASAACSWMPLFEGQIPLQYCLSGNRCVFLTNTFPTCYHRYELFGRNFYTCPGVWPAHLEPTKSTCHRSTPIASRCIGVDMC